MARQAHLELETQEMADLDCPKCAERIATVVVAQYESDLEAMLASGDASAIETLKTHKEIERSLLKTTSDLPDLEDHGKLDFIWDFEWSRDREATTVIRVNCRVIWRERAWFGGQKRFKEVEELLKMRYGDRYGSLKVNFMNNDCSVFYYGD